MVMTGGETQVCGEKRDLVLLPLLQVLRTLDWVQTHSPAVKGRQLTIC